MSGRAGALAGLLAAVAVAALAGIGVFGRAHQSPDAWIGSPSFSAERAWAFAETLAVRFPRRWSGSSDRRAAADWLAQTLSALGLQVHRDTFSAALGAPIPVVLENVWGASRGRERPDELIVALGNYDMAPTSYQAASDTAGHVGTLLELARVIHAAPHRRTFVFLFLDGEEWGMLGARRFARTFADRAAIVAAFSIEDLDPGVMRALGIDAIGQFRGFAPMWMRGLARDAAAREGLPVEEVSPLVEWLQRSVLVSFTDQGPFLGAGIPAVDLAGRTADLVLKDAVYHLPSDTMEHMRPYAFRVYGRIQERILRAVDAMPEVPRESGAYLRLGADRIVPAAPLLAVQVGVFLPLVMSAVWRGRAAARVVGPDGLAVESRALGAMFGVLVAALALVKSLPALGLIPAYELYPPPPRHPELTTVPGPALAAGALIILAVLWQLLRWMRSPARPVEGRQTGAAATAEESVAAAVAVALLWLLAVAAVSLADNPFGAVTFLAFPALLWIWVHPGRSVLRRLANGVLIGLGFVPIVLLVVQYAQVLQLGAYILWYLMMGVAYGQFSLLRILLALATVAVGLRLLVVAALRARRESAGRGAPAS